MPSQPMPRLRLPWWLGVTVLVQLRLDLHYRFDLGVSSVSMVV